VMRALATQLIEDRRGVAATEFALWSVLFFMIALVALDFGDFHVKRAKIEEGVSAAAISAFARKDNVNYSNIPDYVRSVSAESGLSVTATCNGSTTSCTNLNRSCACLKTDGTFSARTCAAACTGAGMTAGTTSGYYLRISASRSFRAMVVPGNLLNNSAIRQTATVRLQ